MYPKCMVLSTDRETERCSSLSDWSQVRASVDVDSASIWTTNSSEQA